MDTNFLFSQTSMPSSPLPRTNLKNVFYKKGCAWHIHFICHLPFAMQHLWGQCIKVYVKGNFWQIFGGGRAETKTGELNIYLFNKPVIVDVCIKISTIRSDNSKQLFLLAMRKKIRETLNISTDGYDRTDTRNPTVFIHIYMFLEAQGPNQKKIIIFNFGYWLVGAQ